MADTIITRAQFMDFWRSGRVDEELTVEGLEVVETKLKKT